MKKNNRNRGSCAKEEVVKQKKTTHKMSFTQPAYLDIVRSVGSINHESGGVLLGNAKEFVVQKFIFDFQGRCSAGGYDPDADYLNKIVKEEKQNGLDFLGFVHSHPRGVSNLSGDFGNGIGDIGYIERIFEAYPDLEKLLVPIIYSSYDGGELKIFPYIAYRSNARDYKLAKLNIVPKDNHVKSISSSTKFSFNPARLSGSVDYELLKYSHVICVGIGGANSICESLVRSGLGRLTVIDFDVVDSHNLITQGFYVSDIGKCKVDALKERLLNINPGLDYNGINADFTELSKAQIKSIAAGADLLLMMTDDFYAQAFGNRVALKYKLPSVFAMMYEKARCSEITFSIPGVTPGCHRCATSSRYKAYEQGYKNDITSTGSTNFHTQYLNSPIGLLSLAILHRNTTEFEFSNWFGNSWDRNLIQLRFHPDYGNDDNSIFNKTFSDIERVFNFDSIWHKVEHESYPKYSQACPDCGGIGDLNLSAYFISLLQNPLFRKSDWLQNDNI